MKLMTPMLVLMSAGLLASCAQDVNPPIVTATIALQGAVDGCDYLVTIDDDRYSPDQGSRDAIDQLDFSSSLTLTVNLAYRRTGKTGRVTCGFDTHMDLPEIEIAIAHFDNTP